MSLLATARGTSVITENIFENRLQHVAELQRMAAIRMAGQHRLRRGGGPV
jgi:UDP-N-acetylglucosamine 1-carboxyvinyltransferase